MKVDPSSLKITDMRFADIDGAPKRCTLIKIFTNQGIVGYGEVRDASSRTYAAMLKSRILGENPCNVEKIFNRIKQFGGDSRQAGGVCGIEVALWGGKRGASPYGRCWAANTAIKYAYIAIPTVKAEAEIWGKPSKKE